MYKLDYHGLNWTSNWQSQHTFYEEITKCMNVVVSIQVVKIESAKQKHAWPIKSIRSNHVRENGKYTLIENILLVRIF